MHWGVRLEYLKKSIFFKKATFKVSGTSYLEDTKKTIGDSFDHQTAIVNIGNPYYVYGGTWKTCTGLSNSEIDGRQKKKPTVLVR